jgi:cation diffusion facilitator CzcD-associated flavoprotein CzcO
VLIIGSANTAFDVMKECHNAGLEVTMNVRSSTYIIPQKYISHERSLGVYNFGVEAADWKLLTLPNFVGAQIAGRFFTDMAHQEPDRYKSLLAAGFPVRDSTDPNQCLSSHLLERAGGHYVDDGGTELITNRKVTLKPNVEPRAYTEEGVRFSDGKIVKANAVVWCTGFRDQDVRHVTAEILGGGSSSGKENQLGPEEIAKLINVTWGLTPDGEIRGMWMAHDGLSVMGGHTQLQRWFAKLLALQICQKVT